MCQLFKFLFFYGFSVDDIYLQLWAWLYFMIDEIKWHNKIKLSRKLCFNVYLFRNFFLLVCCLMFFFRFQFLVSFSSSFDWMHHKFTCVSFNLFTGRTSKLWGAETLTRVGHKTLVLTARQTRARFCWKEW